MIETSLAQAVLDHGLGRGADFVDLFVEQTDQAVTSYLDKRVKEITSGTDFGIGIRVVFGGKALYGYTNITDKKELLRLTELLCAQDERKSKKAFASFQEQKLKSHSPSKHGLDRDVPLAEKIRVLRSIDEQLRRHDLISQVDVSLRQKLQRVAIFNSEGLAAHDERHYTRLTVLAIAADGTEQARAYDGSGGTQGFEFVEGLKIEELTERLARRAITTLKARPCPAGKMPVVIDNGFGGVIFHEACGHLLETTSVEKKASVFHDKMGQMIANPAVTAVDDGLIPHAWGSLNIDDEGMPAKRTVLIENGKLVSFLSDRLGEIKTGYKRTGSGRRQSYKFAPASRMRNTFIQPGPHSTEELIASIDRGIFAKAMGGGSVMPGTGEFNFAVEEAYLIENGKVTEPVKGATLIGTGPEALARISMVANNFAIQSGMCGSISGTIPVTVGQPAIKVDELLVGGQA